MENKTITALKKIVSSLPTTEVDVAIAEQFPQVTVAAAKNVRLDVQDYIDQKIPESQLIHYVRTAGIPVKDEETESA